MRCRRTYAVTVTIILLAGATCAAAGMKVGEWSHRAPIDIEKMPPGGVVETAVTPEVFDAARSDLADLRVGSAAGDEGAYVLRRAQGTSHRTPLDVKLYNRTYVAGKQSSVTIDFGSAVMKNRIDVETPGTNFRRRVVVEGSDDGAKWQTVRDGAFLFRVQAGAGGGEYDKRSVTLSDNNQRYLRVTVFNGGDDPDRVEVKDVKARRLVRVLPETVPVVVAGSEVKQDEKKRCTYVTLDLGYRNLPLHDLTLRFADGNFFRRVSVEGRNRTERIVKTRVEDGPAREKTVPEPWNRIRGGVLYRYATGGGADEELTLGITGTAYRYLRIEIQNGDDPPLQFQSASANRLVHYLVFPPQADGAHFLYLGNPDARSPRYDLSHYVDRLRGEGVTPASLGAMTANPHYRAEGPTIPWSEQFQWVIWLALLAVFGVLALLLHRQIRDGGKITG
ncbi:DUF3999 family protein [Planctomycetota bacterium]